MKIHRFTKAALAAATTLILASCYYDSYSAGYATSSGYVGGGTTFIHTSSDRWFYDPGVRCYYDRHRRAYYDPFLYAYYPVGYCPRPIYNAPHPYGWRGNGIAPIPRNYNNAQQIQRNQDRIALLRQRNYDWAQNVRVRNDASVANWQNQRAQAARTYTAERGNARGRTRPVPDSQPGYNAQPNRRPVPPENQITPLRRQPGNPSFQQAPPPLRGPQPGYTQPRRGAPARQPYDQAAAPGRQNRNFATQAVRPAPQIQPAAPAARPQPSAPRENTTQEARLQQVQQRGDARRGR